MKKVALWFAVITVMSSALPASAGMDWKTALEGAHRAPENIARNEYRHPRETLEFFGLKPDMTVVEIYPGGGWYTEVLAPLLADEGQLYAASFGLNAGTYYRRSLGGYLTKLSEHPDIYDSVIVTRLQPPEMTEIAPPESADLVLAFRNFHSWMRADALDPVLAAVYRALKPGGVFGLVQHRAPQGRSKKDMADSGYVTEAYAIEKAREAGFELVAKSDINANPKDSAEHPSGVWTLPPSLRLGDKDREKYLAIGESDRMTLKFRKPESGD